MLGKLGRRIKLNGPVITAINISLVKPREHCAKIAPEASGAAQDGQKPNEEAGRQSACP